LKDCNGEATEARLAALWEELFGRAVGRTDDFFELGGNSLLGMWLTERIVATFDVQVPARRFYEAPTIADLALAIEELSAAGAASLRS
jgi:hypothetical protein